MIPTFPMPSICIGNFCRDPFFWINSCRIAYLWFFRNESFYVDIPWYNPYRGLTMLHYNPADRRLYFFDSGKLLSVNARVEEDEYEEYGNMTNEYDALMNF